MSGNQITKGDGLSFSYKGMKVAVNFGWKGILVAGIILCSLLGKKVLWPTQFLEGLPAIFDQMKRMDLDPTGLNDLGLPDTEGVNAFRPALGRVRLYDVSWSEDYQPVAEITQLRKFTDMEGVWLGKVV